MSDPDSPRRRSRLRGLVEALVTAVVLLALAAGVVLVLARQHPGTPPRGTPAPTASPTATSPTGVPPTPAPEVIKPGGGPSGQEHGGSLQTVRVDYPLRVTQANIYQGLAWPAVASDLGALTQAGTDLVGLNEITPARAGLIRGWVSSRSGWQFYAPEPRPTPFRLENAILYNERNLRLLRTGSEYGSASATPTYKVDSRWINWVELEHKPSGTHVYFLVTHTDPAVERGGHPRPVAAVGTNLTYLHKLLALARGLAKDGVVVITGDWNVDARADHAVGASSMPYAVLEGSGHGPILSNYSALGFGIPPTSPQSHRWIDYVAIWNAVAVGAPQLLFERQFSSTHVHSDHDPVTVDFRLRMIELLGLDQLRKLQHQAGGG